MGKAFYCACVFDLDEVLVHSEPVFQEAMLRTFEGFGLSLNDEELASMLGRSSREVIPAFLAMRKMSDPGQAEKILKAYREHHSALWSDRVTLMPDVKAVLGLLHRRGIPLAIATMSPTAIVNRFFEKFGLGALFQFFVSIDMVADPRSEQAPLKVIVYQQALASFRLLGFLDPEILAIEDSPVGVQAAKAAGLVCAAVPNQHSWSHDFSMADFIFRPPRYSLKDILPLFGVRD